MKFIQKASLFHCRYRCEMAKTGGREPLSRLLPVLALQGSGVQFFPWPPRKPPYNYLICSFFSFPRVGPWDDHDAGAVGSGQPDKAAPEKAPIPDAQTSLPDPELLAPVSVYRGLEKLSGEHHALDHRCYSSRSLGAGLPGVAHWRWPDPSAARGGGCRAGLSADHGPKGRLATLGDDRRDHGLEQGGCVACA